MTCPASTTAATHTNTACRMTIRNKQIAFQGCGIG
jgi:hypothetical protein